MTRAQAGIWVLVAAGLLGAGCASPKPPRPADPDLERYAGAAQVSFRHGAFTQAEVLYRRALDRARAADDALEIGNNAYNLAACLVAQGRDEEARPLLREARAELESLGQPAAEVLLLDAAAARRSGKPEEAAALLAETRARFGAKDSSMNIQAALLEAHLACDQGDPDRALGLLNGVSRELKRESDPRLRGRAAGLRARIARIKGDVAASAAQLDEEAAWYRKAGGPPGEMAETLRRAGEAWLEAGRDREAADRFYRAARSLFAQGNTVEALKCIEPALSAAEKVQAADLSGRIAALFKEISREVGAAGTPGGAEVK